MKRATAEQPTATDAGSATAGIREWPSPLGNEWIARGEVRWFAWREVRAALAHGRAGGIALHRFRHDLRRFGFGEAEAACHMLSADRAHLIAFAVRFGLRPAWIEPPRPRRPDIWHFDIFGPLLTELEAAYPPLAVTIAPAARSTARQDRPG